jgi:uncharacterized protein
VIEELTIPKCEGRTFTIRKGQVLRLIEVEGLQSADLVAFNLHDFRESLSTWLTRQLNGNFKRAKRIYSKLPAGNVMFTVLTDVPNVFYLSPGRCNRLSYKLVRGVKGYHNNCQDILANCLKEHGIDEWNVPEILNIFMNIVFNEDGTYKFVAPPVKKGDHVDLRAEMDCLVGISACPDDVGMINGKGPKPLRVEIRE